MFSIRHSHALILLLRLGAVLSLIAATFAGSASAQSFSTNVSYTVGENPNSGVAGDFNGDMKPDLAIANVLHNNVTILINNGAGTFTSIGTVPVDRNPEAIVTADFNGDGKLDLAVGNFFGGNLSTGNLSILLGNGNGTFQAAVNFNVGTPADLAVADFNGDNKLDLVVASNTTNKANVLLGNGDGTFLAAVPYNLPGEARGVAIADFNGDTKPDLALTNGHSGNTSILLGNGDGTFQGATSTASGATPTGIIARDINGDAKQDLVIAVSNSQAVMVFLGIGNGTFQGAVSYPVGSGPIDLVLEDFNGDGRADVITVNANDNSYSVLRGNADGSFQAAVTSPARTSSWAPFSGDFNKDGKPDLAILNNAFDLVDVYLNSPSGTGTNFSATEAVAATGLVATFIDFDNTKTAGSFTATINWGDGTATSAGTIAANGAGFNVTGTHTYAVPGTFNVTIQIADSSGNFESVTSTAVVKALTSTSLSTSVTPSDFGQSVTFTAIVTSPAGTPTGSVQFKDGSVSIGSPIALNGSGMATFTTSTLAVGAHIITGQYLGSETFEASSGTLAGGQVVRALTSTALSTSVTPSDFGQSVTFTATVTSSAGTPTGSVQFKDGSVSIGSPVALNGSGMATFTTSTLAVGSHTITAQYSGSDTFATSSGTLAGGQVVRPLPTLSITDESVTEGDSGTKPITFTATLSAASNLAVTVNFATADASATGGTDYQTATGTLTFNPGETTKSVSINVVGDLTNEFDETLLVNLSNPTNAAFTDAQGVGTITNDDRPVLLIDETSGRAVALDSVLLMRDPFSLLNPYNFGGADQRRRISLFVWRLGLLPSDTVANLTVTADDGVGGVLTLTVEHISQVTELQNVTQIIVRLPDNVVGAPRDLSVKVQLRGPATNSAIIKIEH